MLAAILTVAPVCGLRPSRAALSLTEKVPNPGTVILSPLANTPLIASNVASIARVASALVKPAFSATYF